MKIKTRDIVLLCMGLLYIPSPAQNEIAIILKSHGLVTIGHTGENTFTTVSKGYLIMPQAILQTGSTGFATVKYIHSGSTVIMRPGSEAVLNAFPTDKTITESITLKAGELYVDILKTRNHSFDLYTPGALVSFERAQFYILMSKNNEGAVFYNLLGTAKIADNNFTTWKDIPSESVAFVTQTGFVQTYILSPKALDRLRNVRENTLQMKVGEPLVHDIAIKAGLHGTVEPAGRLVVLGGIDVDLKAIPDSNYTFTSWKIIDGDTRIKDPTAPQTQAFILSSVLVEAQFENKPSLLEIVKSESGITEPSGKIFVQKGTSVTVHIAPKRGFNFTGWKKTSDVTIQKLEPFLALVTFTAKNSTIEPLFVRKKYSLTVAKPENGVIAPVKKMQVNHGDTTAISAKPNEGYRFIRWEPVSGYATISNVFTPKTTVVCDSTDAVIRALFSNKAVEVSILKHERAAISPVGNFFVVRNSSLDVTVSPQDGYMVSQWAVERGEARVRGKEKASITCKMPFEIIPLITEKRYTLNLLSDKNGTVFPSESREIIHKIPFSVIASPNQGKYFIRWKLSGGWAEIENPYKDSTQVILSRGNAVIQATFAETVCTLDIETTHGGYTTPAGKMNSYEGGEVLVKAVPDPKAAFIGWEIDTGGKNILFSDTLTEAEQTITSLRGNASIRALFSTETAEITVLSNGLGVTIPEGKFYAVNNTWTTIKAIPNKNQSFVQWTVISGKDVRFKDRFSKETETFTNPDGIVIKALFQPSSLPDTQAQNSTTGTYTLKINYDKNKGTIDKDEEIKVVSGVPVVITVTPKEGYYLDQWMAMTGAVLFSDCYAKTTSVTISKGNAVISPIFSLKPSHILEARFKDYEGRTKTLSSKYR